MERKTRMPSQKRSLEKYEKILTAAFQLFNEKGYYNITTADIAKEAGVATGSVYSYFVDKKEIYIEVLNRISKNIFEPSKGFWIEHATFDLQDEQGSKELFKIFVKLMMDNHNFSKLFHDDMTALKLLDQDVAAADDEQNKRRDQKISEIFELLKIPFKDEESKEVFKHYSNLLIDDACHKILYDKDVKNPDIYIEQSVDMLYKLMKNLSK